MLPPLAVVIAARGGSAPAARALASLKGQAVDPVVVHPADEPESAPSADASCFAVDAHSFAGLRAEGLRRAAAVPGPAPAVAILSQDYTVAADWAAVAARPTEARDADVVCGEVDPPEKGWAARAAYLWEYAHLAPPCRPGPLPADEARRVPAGAVVYRGAARDPAYLRASDSELDYHGRMAADGLRFFRDPRLRVVYHPPPTLAQFRADRRRWSREGAHARFSDAPLAARLAAAVTRLALPPLLLARFTLAVARKPAYWATAVLSTPLACLFAVDQMLGEWRGLLGRGSR